MKINMFKSIVAALAVTGMFTTTSARAADVILSGDVTAITTITIGDTAPLGSDLGTTGLTDFQVVTATEKNNVTAGYKVTVSSASAAAAISGSRDVSKLLLTGNTSTTPIPYTMKYGGVAVVLVAITGACEFTRTTTVNTPDGIDKALTITTSAATSAHAGTYTDTVTLTIAAL